MKALGLSFSMFVFATIATAPAEAHFRPALAPNAKGAPAHDSGEFRRERRSDSWPAFGFGGVMPNLGPDASADNGPQFVPVPVPFGIPVNEPARAPDSPEYHLILIGSSGHAGARSAMPRVIYGDPLR